MAGGRDAPKWAAFLTDNAGQAAILLSIMLIPLMMLISFAVDFSRQESANRHLQSSIDAASLAGARVLEDSTKSDSEIIAVTREAFKANMLSAHEDVACEDADITIDRPNGLVTVSNNCTLGTLFGGAFWKEEVGVTNAATAQAAITKLDLALMLDVSGSMGGQKLTDLKTAAKDAAARLITPQSGDRVRIAFNTYSTSVNAGIYAEDVLDGWSVGDSTCVSEREGNARWKDDAPGPNKWMGNRPFSTAPDNRPLACPTSSVLPLTSDLDAFNTAIDSLSADGWTAGHLGVAWAWYLIAPDWDDVWPAASEPRAYDEENSLKAVILMTDGEFNTQFAPGMNDSDTQSKTLCQKMRDENVIVYAVAFQAPTSAKNTLKDCAGDPDRFFDASNGDELKDAYDAIASQLSNLSLVG
ncbi:MAG: VWA domain-containing protein [Pseudomonadota bacterium]